MGWRGVWKDSGNNMMVHTKMRKKEIKCKKTFVCFLGYAMKVVGLWPLCRTRWRILQHCMHYYRGASSAVESTECFYISLLLVVLVLAAWLCASSCAFVLGVPCKRVCVCTKCCKTVPGLLKMFSFQGDTSSTVYTLSRFYTFQDKNKALQPSAT